MTADTPKPSPNGDLVARSDAWLIVKRDLFYRPKAQGYTGIRDHAGRYTLAEVAVQFPNKDHANQDGITFIHEDDAPEFTDTCFHDLKAAHLLKQRDAARAALAKAERFMSGFEGDITQHGIDDLLREIRAALTPAKTDGRNTR